MKILKYGGTVIASLVVGFIIGFYMFEQFSFDVTRDLKQSISEYQKLEKDIRAQMNAYANDNAFEYIILLQYIENSEIIDVEKLLVEHLTGRYRRVLE